MEVGRLDSGGGGLKCGVPEFDGDRVRARLIISEKLAKEVSF